MVILISNQLVDPRGNMESEEADRPPPHPDQALFDITLTCHQLPPGPHRALQEQLGQAISQASEVFTLMGLDADQSLNCARETAWTMIREFGHIGIGSLFCHWPLFLALLQRPQPSQVRYMIKNDQGKGGGDIGITSGGS